MCGSRAEALAALAAFERPWVIKADGLAAGKGVLVSRGPRRGGGVPDRLLLDQARFGVAGRRVLIEEFLRGEEVSLMAVCDGERFVALPAARDYNARRRRRPWPQHRGHGGVRARAAA